MTEKPGFKDSALRAVAIIGLVAILVLGAWGIIQLVFGLPGYFSTLGNPSTSPNASEQVTTVAPNIVTSDQPFMLSWTHKNGSGNYGYALSYACASGLTFAAPTPAGALQIVPCNTPFNYTNATQSVQLTPVLHTQGQVATSFSVVANRLSDGKITASSTSTSVTVLPARANQTATGSTATPTPTPKPTPKPASASTYTSSGRTSNLFGSADLAVRIISITPSASQHYVAQFVIENVGTNVANAGWMFNAQLPTNPPYTYPSQAQQKLFPGDKIVYTLGFDMPNQASYNTGTTYGYTTPSTTCAPNYTYNGYTNYPTQNTNCIIYNNNTPSYTPAPTYYAESNIFSVTADPQNLIPESTEANNTASAQIGY